MFLTIHGCGGLLVELFFFYSWFWYGLWLLGQGLHDHRRLFRNFRCGWHDVWDLDGALLELVGELLVQEKSNHKDGDDGDDVKDVERRLGGDLLNNGALGVVYDWGAHY